MNYSQPLPNIEPCTHSRGHKWITISKPLNNSSGLQVEECEYCKQRMEYDTSD